MSKKSIENPHEVKYTKFQKLTKSAIDKKSESLLKDKSFCDEYQIVYFLCRLLSPTGRAMSISSGFLALSIIFYPMLGAWAYVLSLTLCVAIEYIKKETGGISIKSILKYKGLDRARKITLTVFVICSITGVSMSVFGAYSFFDMLPSHSMVIGVVEIPSEVVRNRHKPQIDSVNVKADKLRLVIANTNSNSTKRDLNKSLLALTDESKVLTELMIEDLNETKARYKKDKESYDLEISAEQETTKISNQRSRFNFMIAALLIELCLIISDMFLFYYYYRNEESNTNGFGIMDDNILDPPLIGEVYVNRSETPQMIEAQAKTEPVTPVLKEVEAPRKIGFGNGTDGIKTQTVTKQPKVPNVSGSIDNGLCDNPKCGKSFERKTILKKYCNDKCRSDAYRIRKQLEAKNNGNI